MKNISFLRIPLVKLIRVFITLFSLSFVGYSILINADELFQTELELSSIWILIIAFSVSWISLIVNAIAWNDLIKWINFRSNLQDIVPLFLRSNLLKYVPGGIWHFLERIRYIRQYMSTANSITLVLIEPIFMLISALLLVPIANFSWSLLIFCMAPLVLFYKKFITSFVNQINKIGINKIKAIDSDIEYHKVYINTRSSFPLRPLLLEVSFVIIRFLGFWLCLSAFGFEKDLNFVKWLSYFSFSWIAGLVMPSAPGGVGVFETAFLLISSDEPILNSDLLLGLLSYRLIVSLVDVFAALFYPERSRLIK